MCKISHKSFLLLEGPKWRSYGTYLWTNYRGCEACECSVTLLTILLIIEISYSDGNWLISLNGFSTFQNHLLSIVVLNVMQVSTWKTPNGKVWLVKMLIIGQGYSDAFCLNLRAFATENGLKKVD